MPKQKKKITKETSGYLWSMSEAPGIDESYGIFQMIPLMFFKAIIIIIVRMVQYTRNVTQFFWANRNELVDFFSYAKMVAILICATVVLLLLLYRLFSQSFAMKGTLLYIPIIIYSAFVILSHLFSDYKEFALLGFNERFEGTLVLLAYMIILFFAINTINTERDVKLILYSVVGSSILLGLLGVSQAIGHDFFRTRLGGMMITPRSFWDSLDYLTFTFRPGQIYQTVYNLNYVSFYLSLLIPVFSFLFIHSIMKGKSEKLWKKIFWGFVVALALFNLIGSNSIGGAFGLGVAAIVAIILLGRKLFLEWRKPVLILLIIAIPVVVGTGYQQWIPKIIETISTVFISEQTETQTTPDEIQSAKSYIDHIVVHSEEAIIDFSINGNELSFFLHRDNWPSFDIIDADGNIIELAVLSEEEGVLYLDDERFNMCTVRGQVDVDGNSYFIINTDGQDWPFFVAVEGVFFINELGRIVEMRKIEAIGFRNNQSFGSGRGYIWSRTLPMMRDTWLIGHGADTYAIFFPHNDYAGKYNAGWQPLSLVVDKPHNMYMHMAVGTGGVSMAAFLALLALYFIQSIKIYWRRNFSEFIEFAGVGIFLGVLGFSFAALVNDSSVSVMPLFYGVLGTGIAINLMLKRNP